MKRRFADDPRQTRRTVLKRLSRFRMLVSPTALAVWLLVSIAGAAAFAGPAAGDTLYAFGLY